MPRRWWPGSAGKPRRVQHTSYRAYRAMVAKWRRRPKKDSRIQLRWWIGVVYTMTALSFAFPHYCGPKRSFLWESVHSGSKFSFRRRTSGTLTPCLHRPLQGTSYKPPFRALGFTHVESHYPSGRHKRGIHCFTIPPFIDPLSNAHGSDLLSNEGAGNGGSTNYSDCALKRSPLRVHLSVAFAMAQATQLQREA